MLSSEQIVGTWSLDSFIIEKDDQANPWRDGAYGLLIYSHDGYMSVSVNVPKSDPEWERYSFFYAGTYRLESEGTVAHSVRNASNPARIGQTLLRKASLKDDRLQLIAADPGEGPYSRAILVWTKHRV